MSYFLLVYDRREGRLVRDPLAFPDDQADRALRERFAMEDRERSHPDIEVVLLGAESLQALRSTHGRYFKSIRELATST